MRTAASAVLLICACAWTATSVASCLAGDVALAEAVNAYRLSQGASCIPISVSLTAVARAHVDNSGDAPGTCVAPDGAACTCNVHSWAGETSSSPRWPGCCFGKSSDGCSYNTECMSGKPKEVTNGVYDGLGWEISTAGFGTNDAAIASWAKSASHGPFLLNSASRALGCATGISPITNARVHHCWFGMGSDDKAGGGFCPGTKTGCDGSTLGPEASQCSQECANVFASCVGSPPGATDCMTGVGLGDACMAGGNPCNFTAAMTARCPNAGPKRSSGQGGIAGSSGDRGSGAVAGAGGARGGAGGNGGAIAGGVVAAIVCLAILGGVLFIVVRKKKNEKRRALEQQPQWKSRPKSEKAPDLPPGGWAAAVDPSSGDAYYYQPSTGKTTWELPDGVPCTGWHGGDVDMVPAPDSNRVLGEV